MVYTYEYIPFLRVGQIKGLAGDVCWGCFGFWRYVLFFKNNLKDEELMFRRTANKSEDTGDRSSAPAQEGLSTTGVAAAATVGTGGGFAVAAVVAPYSFK